MWFENRAPIQYSEVVTAAGATFNVPELIIRVDEPPLHGWQLRFGEWTLFEDKFGEHGAAEALALAIAEMTERVEYRGK